MAVHPNSLKNLEKGKQYQFTAETARIYGSKGGTAAAPELARRRTIRAELEDLLVKHPVNKKGEESPLTFQAAMISALVKKALEGDTKAFEIIRDTIGEKPAEKVMLAQIDQATIDEVEQMVRDHDTTAGG